MSKAKGDIAEQRACGYLVAHGFTVKEQNFYSRFGEIDIIAKKDDVYHFVEVKSGLDYELAINNITPAKIAKIIKTIDVYNKKNALKNDYLIDAIVVTPESIEFVENITI